MSRTTDRLVRNQVLFREVNERVREVLDDESSDIEFLCECSNEDCIETILLSGATYERVRSKPNRFLVVEGHEVPELEQVVEEGLGFALVEKHVDVDFLAQTDPRGSGA